MCSTRLDSTRPRSAKSTPAGPSVECADNALLARSVWSKTEELSLSLSSPRQHSCSSRRTNRPTHSALCTAKPKLRLLAHRPPARALRLPGWPPCRPPCSAQKHTTPPPSFSPQHQPTSSCPHDALAEPYSKTLDPACPQHLGPGVVVSSSASCRQQHHAPFHRKASLAVLASELQGPGPSMELEGQKEQGDVWSVFSSTPTSQKSPPD